MKNYEFRLIPSKELSEQELTFIHDLFDMNYREANHAYLDQSLGKLRFTAMAFDGEIPIGFALGDAVQTELPELTGTHCAALAGICCISPHYRRQGLFSSLEMKSIEGSGVFKRGVRSLLCGRMAHPASFRLMRGFPSVVPRYGISPTSWQRKVGLRVAELYGVVLDPSTFVVKGKGSPIGYPKIEMDVGEEEWLPFKPVNRDRGDSLLGICWVPDAPEGW
jgi:hypothetical protein